MDPEVALQEPLLQPQDGPQAAAPSDASPSAHGRVQVVFEESVMEAKSGWSEARRLVALAVPLSAGEVLSYLGYLIVIAQIGRLGPLELSAVSLGSTFFNITGLSL